MRRNRSIRTLPLENLNLLKHPLPEHNEKLYFGEEIEKNHSSVFDKSTYVSSDDSDLILTSVRDVGNSKSSSSSLSWGEEYKSEASQQLCDELQRMDNVLMGLEPIPDNYDAEEYNEWMEFFPNLCVVGTKISTYVQSTSKPVDKNEEILAIHPNNPSILKPSVMEQINSKVPPKIMFDSIDIDNYLKVSSFGGSKLPRRQSSSRSLISSQISSSKWLKDEDYNSLPFLPQVKSVKGVRKGILKNSLVLPPIESSQFRSISATPRRESKSLSALSVKSQKFSGFKRTLGKDAV